LREYLRLILNPNRTGIETGSLQVSIGYIPITGGIKGLSSSLLSIGNVFGKRRINIPLSKLFEVKEQQDTSGHF
jgi:hypothetical protein